MKDLRFFISIEFGGLLQLPLDLIFILLISLDGGSEPVGYFFQENNLQILTLSLNN